jgi:hypothetical protein
MGGSLLVLLALSGWTYGGPDAKATDPKAADLLKNAARIQVPFVANQGQIADEGVAFYARTFGGTVHVRQDGSIHYALPKLSGAAASASAQLCTLVERPAEAAAAKPAPLEPARTKVASYVGAPGRWRSGLATFQAVSLGEVYPGISLLLRAHGNNVEKIFTVAPGADPAEIGMTVEGAERMQVGSGGGNWF